MPKKKRYRVKQGCTIKRDGKVYPHPATIELTEHEAMVEFWRDLEFTDPGQVKALQDKVNDEWRNGRRTALRSRNQYVSDEEMDNYLRRH